MAEATAVKMVKVQVVAEQLVYSRDNGDGTHTRSDYRRGDVFEMDEKSARQAAEGDPCKEVYETVVNSAGTHAFSNPPKQPGVPRAAVLIVTEDRKVSAPTEVKSIVPAPAPKPATLER